MCPLLGYISMHLSWLYHTLYTSSGDEVESIHQEQGIKQEIVFTRNLLKDKEVQSEDAVQCTWCYRNQLLEEGPLALGF